MDGQTHRAGEGKVDYCGRKSVSELEDNKIADSVNLCRAGLDVSGTGCAARKAARLRREKKNCRFS